MKSCLSLIAALLVVAALAAGGYILYQKVNESSGETSLTLNNKTTFPLTVNMKGPLPVQFAIAPGNSQTRTVAPGDYEIDGSLADSKTEPFHGTWHFERGVKYNSDFTRSGDGGSGGQLVSLEMLRAAPAATGTKP